MSKRARVLIVDDDPSLRKYLMLVLESLNYEVAGNASSQASAEKLALDLNPDIIIMDVLMETPDAGINAAKKIAQHIEVPIVYLTTDAGESTLQNALSTEPFGYLVKPVQPDNLKAAIEISLLRHREKVNMRNYQEALEKAEKLFHGIFSTMQSGYYRIDADHRFLLVNPAFLNMLGYSSPDEVVGKDVTELGFFDVSERKKINRRLNQGKCIKLLESTWKDQSGKALTVLENIHAFYNENDTLEYYEGTIQDISSLRRLENQLRLSQKMEVIGIMASRLAHEFNNKLTSIVGYADLCIRQVDEKDKIVKYLDTIKSSTKNAADVIQQMLSFSRKSDEHKPIDFRLDEFIHNQSEMISAICTSSISVHHHVSLENGMVHADPHQIEQVLINLVINARDAMPDGGNLVISLENEKLGSKGRHAGSHDDHYVRLTISDSGTGINPNDLDKVFEPFYTTKKKGIGTGLGLSIVKGIVEANHGFISVSSILGKGTDFEILLPSASNPEE